MIAKNHKKLRQLVRKEQGKIRRYEYQNFLDMYENMIYDAGLWKRIKIAWLILTKKGKKADAR